MDAKPYSAGKPKERKEKKDKKEKKEKKRTSEADAEAPLKKHKSDKDRKDKKDKKSKSSAKASTGLWSYVQAETIALEIITAFLEKNEILITFDNKPHELQPILEFKQAGFPTQLTETLEEFPAPTLIQSVTWPPILQGRDLVGIASTGSGKTLAFGVPGVMHIQNKMAQGSSSKPQVLVLSPTRELAMQIQEQFERFGKSNGMKSVCIYGGVSKYEQKSALKQGMNAIVATPGRLIDLFEEDSTLCDLSDIGYLVLDEADRMLDQGFEEAIRKIIARLPKTRQTVMFSATW